MFQIARFTAIEKPGTSKTSTPVGTSGLALQSLLKRAEVRKREQDEQNGVTKKRPAVADSNNVKDPPKKKKKKTVTSIRDETTLERDSRKASAKADKKLRKDLVRGETSTGKILIKTAVRSLNPPSFPSSSSKQKVNKAIQSAAADDDNDNDDDNDDKDYDDDKEDDNDDEEEEEQDDLMNGSDEIVDDKTLSEAATDIFPLPKSFAEQLQPSNNGRDESRKVLSKKRTDDDEDFIGDGEINESPTEHPELMTVKDSLESWELDSLIAKNLQEDGIDSFFPVQRLVIPQLLRNNSRLCVQPRDMCVSAPTGSGKTIAYAVPIIQSLRNRSIVRLRALLLLPSRELATQVYGVFCRLSRGMDLGIAVCTGQTPLEDEQRLIIGACYNGSKGGRQGLYNYIDSDPLFSNRDMYFKRPSTLGISAVDILICTPGRLLDHIQYTEGFTLQHLRFLVLDEADRLLGNAYHSWVRTLVQSAHSTDSSSAGSSNIVTTTKEDHDNKFALKGENIDESNIPPPLLPFLAVPQHPLQRLLFSATLTDNPRKLAMLGMTNPLIIRATSSDVSTASSEAHGQVVVNGDQEGDEMLENGLLVVDKGIKQLNNAVSAASGYMLPQTLEESVTVCETARRPLVLLSMLLEVVGIPSRFNFKNMNPTRIDGNSVISNICDEKGSLLLVFSSSVDTTHRLCRLLQLFNNSLKKDDSTNKQQYLFGGRVAEMSRLMRSDEREIIMRDAASGAIKILVSSDHMARGIDLPNIKLVINYDPPKHAKMYVHRVGRTARANRIGYSVTLLKAGQVGAFKKMRGTIGSGSAVGLLKYKSNTELEGKIGQDYNDALQKLSGIIEKEGRGELTVGESI